MSRVSNYVSSFMRRLDQRGLIHQVTHPNEVDQVFIGAEQSSTRVAGYIGFDATAPSLHIGSLVQLMVLRALQKSGHTPVVLVGGATTLVGDPSGKTTARPLLTKDEIASNISGIKTVFQKVLDFSGPTAAQIVDNGTWLGSLNLLEFLRVVGPHVTINRMLTHDSVKLRLDREQPLSLLEFNYMLLQGYDFLSLHRSHNVLIQFGGSDQWGNITTGIELTRKIDGGSVYGVTTPLITTSDGRKMGKSESGAVWLDASRTSPFDYWQYWRNVPDADVGRFLRLFTELPLEHIEELESRPHEGLNSAKIVLANEATALIHGVDVVNDIRISAERSINDPSAILESTSLPVHHLSSLENGKDRGDVLLVHALVEAGICSSNNEARRSIDGGGVKVNGMRVEHSRHVLSRESLTEPAGVAVSIGKKKHIRLIMLTHPS